MTCGKEHGRVYMPHESKGGLGTLSLCYHNKDTEWLQKIVKNNISLMVCENHRDRYIFEEGVPLSMEAYNASVNDILTKHHEELSETKRSRAG